MMLIFAAAMGLLAAPEDRPGMPMAEGFMMGYARHIANGTMEQRVPRGETVEDWNRMITLIRLDVPDSPAVFLESIEQTQASPNLSKCPNAVVSPRVPAMVGIYPALDGRVDCPLNPDTGKPETFFYRLFSAGGALYMAQVAFRHVPDASETAWANAKLAGFRLCSAGATDAVCAL
jgi:hypothetical protein